MLHVNSASRDDRREAAVELMADHLLAKGLAGATLRPLAAAAGTSDRMLLYYFSDKDELLAAILDRISARMMRKLDEAIPVEPTRSFDALLDETWLMLASEGLKSYMPLWLDLAAGSARGLQPHLSITGRIADGVLSWITARLPVDERGEPSSLAPKFLAMIEGLYLVSAFGREAVADVALRQMRSSAERPGGRTIRLDAKG